MNELQVEQAQQEKGHSITQENNHLQERSQRLWNLENDVRKTQENIAMHDEDMQKITRVLQKQIDEKQETIQRYREKL